MRVIELFGGIGACTKALKKLGLDIEVVDYVEINKYSVDSYNAINGTDFKPQDISEWDKHLENIDLIMHGSHCQDFSLAGKQAGGDKDSGTRSSLMYETIRIVEDIKPKYVVWENVKNLLSKTHIHNFNAYINKMDLLGYDSYFQVMNSADYGVPQRRERIFVVSIRKDISKYNLFEPFVFPKRQNSNLLLKDFLEKEVDKKYYLSKKKVSFFEKNTELQKAKGNGFRFKPTDGNVIAKTITTRAGCRMDDNFIIVKEANKPQRVRKLTPKECFRLMGFDDDDFKKALDVNSDTQLYKQAGNSIVVNVLYEIFKKLLIE